MISHLRSMLGRLQSLRQKITHLNPWVVFFGILVLAVLAFAVLPAHAQSESGVGDWMVRQVGKIMLVIANIAIGLTIFFLRFFIMIASYNNYIDVDVVQLGWIMVRDVANMFFVVALLVIAFGTILGLEEYEWKKNLAKLILAAILINFSNLICQLFIDVAHVFTITFLNAISATAGGNLISMFKLTEITRLASTQDPSGIDLELLAAVIPAMMFAIMAAAAIGSYVYVMTLRVVALWALIILSPLAFILGVLPKTKSYAEKWWSEFTNNVIVAPIMVFFLWLAFATLGLGNIANQIQNGLPPGAQITGGEDQYGWKPKLSLSNVTTWENMANFLIAFAFLMRGIEEAQQTGATGAGAIGGAVDFAKKVGTIASGYAAGRWLAGKTKDMAVGGAMGALKGAGKLAYMGLLEDRVERIKNTVQRNTVEAWRNWRNSGPEIERVDEKMGEGQDLTEEEKAKGYAIQERKVKGDDGVEKTERYKTYAGYKYDLEKDKDGNIKYDENGEAVKNVVFRNGRQKFFYNRHMKLLQSRKQLEKVQKDTQLNEDMMDKSIEAQPVHLLAKKGERDMDRIKMGMLEAMEERSSAKTGEFKSMGREIVMGSKRYKIENDRKTGKLRGAFQNDRPTIAGQIAGHKEKQAERDKRIDQILATEKTKYQKGKGKNVLEGRVKAELEIKAQEAESHRLEAGATTRVALADIGATDKFNTAMAAYQARLAGKGDSRSDEYKREAAQIASEMADEGLISEKDAADLRKNAQLNEQIDAMEARGMDKTAAMDELVATGQMTEEQKKKVGADGYFAEVYTGPRANVLARTVESEKAGHLETTRLERAQKAEEEKFTKGAHGQEELREETVLKEQIAASEETIKREGTDVKAKVAEGTEGDTEAFRKAQAARIAAQKQTEVREGRASVVEKAADLKYEKSGEGKEEREKDLIAKETIAATEAHIKKAEAARKAGLAEDNGEFQAQMAARIASEKQAHTEEEKVTTVEKEATEEYVLGSREGRRDLKKEAELKARQAASDAAIKEEETKADRVYRDDFLQEYKPRLANIQRDLNSKDKGTRDAAEQQMAALWDDIERDKNPVARKLAAEKRTKTESGRVEQLEKSMDQIYSGSSEGAREMELDARIAASKSQSEADIKRRETAAQRTFKKSQTGKRIGAQTKGFELQTQAEEAEIKHIDAKAAKKASEELQSVFDRINIAEQGTKAAEEFIKTLKSDKLKNTFKEAAEIMAKIMKDNAGNRDLMGKRLDKAAETNTFISALKSSVKQKISDDEQKRHEVLATEAAKAGFDEIPHYGKATPSTAIDPMVAQASKDLKSMESQDGGALAARWIATILRQQREKSAKGESISDHQRATLFAAISHITNEAWTDDTLGEISALFSDLDNEKIDANSDEGKDIQELKDVFIGKLGLMQPKADGTGYKSYSTPEGAAALQGLVVMGGNTKFVQAHNKVAAIKDTLGSINKKEVEEKIATNARTANPAITDAQLEIEVKTKFAEHIRSELENLNLKMELNLSDVDVSTLASGLNHKSSYEDVAKALANNKLLSTDSGIENFGQFEEELERVQDIMQEASSVFKRGALNAKHIQNGGHQAYDARWGGQGKYRLMTPAEARELMAAEGVKRSGLESSQYHSFGKVDNERSRLVQVDEKMFRVLTGQVVDASKIGAVLQRTLDQLMGYKAGAVLKQDEAGRFKMGGDFGDIKELMEESDDGAARTKFVREMLMPMINGNVQAFQLMLSKKGGVSNSIEANAGLVNASLDLGLGAGKEITGRKFSEFMQKIVDNAAELGISELEATQIKKTIKSYQSKESRIQDPKPPQPPAPAPAPAPAPGTPEDDPDEQDDET